MLGERFVFWIAKAGKTLNELISHAFADDAVQDAFLMLMARWRER